MSVNDPESTLYWIPLDRLIVPDVQEIELYAEDEKTTDVDHHLSQPIRPEFTSDSNCATHDSSEVSHFTDVDGISWETIPACPSDESISFASSMSKKPTISLLDSFNAIVE